MVVEFALVMVVLYGAPLTVARHSCSMLLVPEVVAEGMLAWCRKVASILHDLCSNE